MANIMRGIIIFGGYSIFTRGPFLPMLCQLRVTTHVHAHANAPNKLWPFWREPTWDVWGRSRWVHFRFCSLRCNVNPKHSQCTYHWNGSMLTPSVVWAAGHAQSVYNYPRCIALDWPEFKWKKALWKLCGLRPHHCWNGPSKEPCPHSTEGQCEYKNNWVILLF